MSLQSQATYREILATTKIGTVFLIDPTQLPQGPNKPNEEDFTDVKILFFHPASTDIHEQRKQVGISEGIVNFFKPFSEEEAPIECISTSTFTHVLSQVEPDIWLNIVIQHPEALYGSEQKMEGESDGETIANCKFTYSTFAEEDSRILHQVVRQFYAFLLLFHGRIKDALATHRERQTMHLWREQMADFTEAFSRHFFTKDYTSNFFWNLSYQGFFYCPIDKKSFLQAQFVQNSILMDFGEQVAHCAIFHENYFICSSLPHLNIQVLYSYLVGIQDQTAAQSGSQHGPADQRTSIAALLKVGSFKGEGQLERIHPNQPSREEQLKLAEESKSTMNTERLDRMGDSLGVQEPTEETKGEVVIDPDYISQQNSPPANLSNFTRVNPHTAAADWGQSGQLVSSFLIGPQFRQSSLSASGRQLGAAAQPDAEYVEVFAPLVYLHTSTNEDDEDSLQAFRMFVFLGFKTLTVLLFRADAELTVLFINSINAHLTRQVPILSQLLDQIVTRPAQSQAQQEDPLRFFYFSRMNLAIKLSNLQAKDVFTIDLKLILSQLHAQFQEEPECQEQQMNTSYFWVVGINSLGREIYLIFPPNYSNAKVEQEKNKIMRTYFANLFV